MVPSYMFHQQATVGFGFGCCIKSPADALAPSSILLLLFNQTQPRRNGVIKVTFSAYHHSNATNRDGSSHYFPPEASTTRAEDRRAPTKRPLAPQVPEPPPSATQSRISRRLNVYSFFPRIPRLIPASSRTPEPPNLWNPVNAPIRQPTPAQHAFQQIPRRLEPRDEYSRFSVPSRQRESGNQSRSSLQVQASEISRISGTPRPRAQYSKAFSPKGKEPAYLSEPPMAAPPISSSPSITRFLPAAKDPEQTTPNTPKPIPSAPSTELPWGPAHPCFPHINPHVPLASPLIKTTRIIRIRRDWMIAGDLAPAFSDVYPEILDPWMSEQDFRSLIQNVNEGLLQAFNPLGWRAWVDAVLGIATAWLWEDLGFTGAKSGVRGVEAFIERWNTEKSGKDAESEVRIIPLRRTGYLSVSRGAVQSSFLQLAHAWFGSMGNFQSKPSVHDVHFVYICLHSSRWDNLISSF